MIVDIVTKLRDYLDELVTYPFFTERMPETSDTIIGVVYFDDSSPWLRDANNKDVILNPVVALRFSLDIFDSSFTESDAMQIVFDLENRLIDNSIPPGIRLQTKSIQFRVDENLPDWYSGYMFFTTQKAN